MKTVRDLANEGFTTDILTIRTNSKGKPIPPETKRFGEELTVAVTDTNPTLVKGLQQPYLHVIVDKVRRSYGAGTEIVERRIRTA